MDQILVSVCCPPQTEHADIKNVAISHVFVILRRCGKCPKIMFFIFIFFVTFFIQTFSQELLVL